MRHAILTLVCVATLVPLPSFGQSIEKKWTLQECIDHAMANNITLKKNQMQKLSVKEDVELSKAQLLPSLNASTSQNIIYRPFIASGQSTVANGYVQSSIDKVYYSGSYSVSANWTVWNGKRNKNTIKYNELLAEQAEVDSMSTARSIEERIVQLYVQILYTNEAISVNEQSLASSKL
ncbi:MAG: TolC family protein, partial [Muribaculaceae bacterium]|nr:TolC family protein [Muribaculaceae bacterium]